MRLFSFTVPVPSIRAAALPIFIAKRSPDQDPLLLDIITNAKATDDQLAAWVASDLGLPEYPMTIRQQEESTEDMWKGDVDIYTDIYVAQLWNIYRTCRITLHNIITRALRRLNPDDPLTSNQQFRASTAILQEMADGICASVPFLLGYRLVNEHDSLRMEKPDMESPALGAYLALWPLQMAVSASYTSSDQKRWVQGRLVYLGEQYGIQAARVLSTRWSSEESDVDFIGAVPVSLVK